MRCTSALMNCDSSYQAPLLLLPSPFGSFQSPNTPSVMTILIVFGLTVQSTNSVWLHQNIHDFPHLRSSPSFFFSHFGSTPLQCYCYGISSDVSYFQLGSWSQLFFSSLTLILPRFSLPLFFFFFFFFALFLHFLSRVQQDKPSVNTSGERCRCYSVDSLLHPLTHSYSVFGCVCVYLLRRRTCIESQVFVCVYSCTAMYLYVYVV